MKRNERMIVATSVSLILGLSGTSATASQVIEVERVPLSNLSTVQDVVPLEQLVSLSSLASLRHLSSLNHLSSLERLASVEGLASLEGLSTLERLSSAAVMHGWSTYGSTGFGLDRVFDGNGDFGEWYDVDPAVDPDSLNRLARQELNRGNYRQAARLYRELRTRYPDSRHTPDSYYWEAFALYRTGDRRELEQAVELLQVQERQYPRAATRDDARSLAVQINGRLAERGDSRAAEGVVREAVPGQASCPRDDDDIRIVALNALLHMNAEQALPILREVLERRDACWVEMRRKAIFLVSQKRSDETTDILLDAARNDPDTEVQANAVFWLSQVHSDEAVDALDSILMSSDNEEIQEKAIFSLSQHGSARAANILRRYVERTDVPSELRGNAIFWIGQSNSRENVQFLRDLYHRVDNTELKEKIIFGLSQQSGEESGQWLLEIALDRTEPVDLRKSALFWAGQKQRLPVGSLLEMYRTVQDREMKEQVIFVLSQRHDRDAIDALMDIARTEQDTDLRKNAIFWLGQSNDPRVAEFLLELINRP